METLSYYDSIALGLVAGCTRAFQVGTNPDVDSGTLPEDCWGGTGLYPWLSAATSLELVSTSANDTAGGTGAQVVQLSILDSNYNPLTRLVAMNGITPVIVPGNILRINGIRCMNVGSGGVNTGDIVLRDAGAGTTRGIVLAGQGLARQTAYTVPLGYTLLIKEIVVGIDSPSGSVGQFCAINTYFKAPGMSAIYPLPLGTTSVQPYGHYIGDPAIVAQQRTDFSMPVTKVSDNNSVVTTGWNGILRSNK